MMAAEAALVVREVYDECNNIFSNAVRDAYLYGSCARGDFDTESDIDILLTVDADASEIAKRRYAIAAVTSALSLKYGITVSVTAKPLTQFRRYAEVVPFYKNVVQEGLNYAV